MMYTIDQLLQQLGELLAPLWILGPFGLWRWGVWSLRKIGGWRYRPLTPTATGLSASVVIPVYKEDPDYFLKSLHSIAAEGPNAIIAVIDHGDHECIALFSQFQKADPQTRHLIITPKPGKRAALVDGIRQAQSDVVILVDSDVVWEQGVLAKILAPFADPKVGGVGTRQNVDLPAWQWQPAAISLFIAARIFDLYLDMRYLDEMRFLGRQGHRFTCLSGRTAAYRRAALTEPVLVGLEQEFFRGREVISGDDKRLTNLVQSQGWLLRYQENARVYTHGAGILKYQKQRLRWTRNTWRADITTLSSGWLWRWSEKAFAFHMFDRVVMQGWTSLLSPLYFGVLLWHQNYSAALGLVAWWLFSRALKVWPSLRRDPINWLLLPIFILATHLFAIQRVYAFFPMEKQGWITRGEKQRFTLWQRLLNWLQQHSYQLPRAAATSATLIGIFLVLNTCYLATHFALRVLLPVVFK
jgi:hyaluronan synthase